MATISTAKRKSLPSGSFALPSQRKYPIHDAAHVRNAAARLEQAKKAGKISSGDYATAKRAIARAAKRFGIESEYNSSDATAPKNRANRLHVRADLAQGGSLHVRHMSDPDIMLDGVAVELSDSDAKQVWIQLAKPGTFKGHPAGPFELNEAVFSDIIRNFASTQNRAIPIDFEHASEADPTQGSIPTEGAPAQGWIRDLKIQGGSLWGLVEWGAKAREYIRSGQYKFFSPAIRFGARDRVTGQQIGARMTSGALTNNPFLDGMKPLAAKDAAAENVIALRLAHEPHEYMSRLKAILRLPELSTARETGEHLDRLRDHFDAAGGDPDGVHEGVRLADFCRPMRDLVGATPGTTWEQVFDVVEDLIDAAIDEHVIEDHGGQAEMSDDEDQDNSVAEMSDRETEKSNMSEPNATAIALSEAQTKVAELTLKLKDETSRADEAEKELKELRDWKSKREDKDFTDRVDLAFETYKDARKLTDADKEAMLIVLKAKPETFEKQYPKVSASQQYLQRNLTDHRSDGTQLTVIDGGGSDQGGEPESFQQTTKRLMREKKLSYVDAQNLAVKLRAGR